MIEDRSINIPDKKYFQINEVVKICEIKAHTLRFWEKEFDALQPMTRKGGRRYYTKKDIDLLLLIKSLLYKQGFTINGAIAHLSQEDSPTMPVIKEIIFELEEVLKVLKS